MRPAIAVMRRWVALSWVVLVLVLLCEALVLWRAYWLPLVPSVLLSKSVYILASYAITLHLSLALLVLVVARKHGLRFAYGWFFAILTLLLLAYLAHGMIGVLGFDSLRQVANANSEEAYSFALQLLSGLVLVKKGALALAPLLAAMLLAVLMPPMRTPVLARVGRWLGLLLLLWVGVDFVWSLRAVYRFEDSVQVTEAKMTHNFAAQKDLFSRQGPEVNVLVYIGESTSRQHWNLYGYPRNTNEPLEPFEDDLILFDDVVSPHSYTSESLYRALTLTEQFGDDQLQALDKIAAISVVDVLKQYTAGVTWFSNQNRAGKWDTASTLFGRKANNQLFLSSAPVGVYSSQRPLDENLVSNYQALSAAEIAGKVVFLHSYAGHGSYCDHIPEQYKSGPQDRLSQLSWQALYGDMSVVSQARTRRNLQCYDGAMRYISANLAALIGGVKNASKPTVLLYFSDHGEDVRGNTGHSAQTHSHRHSQVPFMLYFNEAAKQALPQKYAAAKRNQHKPFNSDWLADSLLDLVGIHYSARPLLSIFDPTLKPPSRYVMRRDLTNGQSLIVPVDAPLPSGNDLSAGLLAVGDNVERFSLARKAIGPAANKICGHRSNSLFKYAEVIRAFGCVEMDIEVDAAKQALWVGHAPKPLSGLQLSDLVTTMPLPSQMWLDVKNLNAANGDFLVAELKALFPRHQASRVLVETAYAKLQDVQFVAQMKALSDWGFRLSYYLPTAQAISCGAAPQQNGCQDFKEAIETLMSKGVYQSLSFDAKAATFVKTLKLPDALEINVWDLAVNSRRLDLRNQDLLERATMYLVTHPTPFDY